jgi:hypothetical protein
MSLSRWCRAMIFAMVAGGLLPGCSGGRVFVNLRGSDIKVLTLNPPQLARFVGGQVVITALLRDGSGIKKVTATVVRQSDGQLLADVTLQRVAPNRYEVTIVAPANMRDDGRSEVYQVTVVATAQQGHTGKMADGTFEVPAPPAPPPPPSP